MKKRIFLKTAAFGLLLSMLFSLSAVFAGAYNTGESHSADKAVGSMERRTDVTLAVKGIANTGVWRYNSLPVTRDGRSLGIRALFINGTYYIPVRDFINKTTNMSVSYHSGTRTLTVSGSGFKMSASDGSYVVYANDRALFDMTPARIMSDGKMYIPAKTMAKALGLSYSQSASAVGLNGTVKPLTHASRYYDEEAVLWLGRIISAESRGEPLIGQIAVGNVILNRVRSKSFPNTIWGVIFDKKYGIQFEPVANGTIYNTPAFTSSLAAKIVLEGFTVSDEVLYFVAPRNASSSWIANTRRYLFTIKNHEFYA